MFTRADELAAAGLRMEFEQALLAMRSRRLAYEAVARPPVKRQTVPRLDDGSGAHAVLSAAP